MLLKNQTIYILFIVCIIPFSSCKKGLDEVDYPNTVYLPQSGLSEHTLLLGESIYSLGVYKAGINHPGKVTVGLTVDNEHFAEFLISNPSYEILPEKYYSLPNNEVFLETNNENIPFDIHLKNIDENYIDKNYILPISIAQVSEGTSINPDKSIAYLHFKRYRNFYEGEYRAIGTTAPINSPDQITRTDQLITSLSSSANSLIVPGPEAGMNVLLVISKDQVKVQAAIGSEQFLIKDGGKSKYSGQFDPIYQRFRGNFNLSYSYIKNGEEVLAIIDLIFTL